MNKYYIDVKGGTGLNIGLCHVLNYLKDNYPDDYEFNVASPYFDLFEACPAVKNVYKPNEMKDFIFDAKDNDGIIVEHRLYDMSDFIYKKLNYTQAWLKLMEIPTERWPNIDANAETTPTTVTSKFNVYDKYPVLKSQVEQVLAEINKQGYKNFVITQFTGGQSPLVQVPANPQNGQPDWSKVPYQYENEPLKRHYPTELVKEFANLFHQEHPDTAIITFQLPNEPDYGKETIRFVIPYLCYYMLAQEKNCLGTISIDSCLQHLVAGVTKSVVIWGHSLPENFGYLFNNNIIQRCRRDDLLYFTALGPSGAKIDYIKPVDLLAIVNEYIFNNAPAETIRL